MTSNVPSDVLPTPSNAFRRGVCVPPLYPPYVGRVDVGR